MRNSFLSNGLFLSIILTISGCQSTLISTPRSGDTSTLTTSDPYQLLEAAQQQPLTARTLRMRLKAAEGFAERALHTLVTEALAPIDAQSVPGVQRDTIARLRAAAWLAGNDPARAEVALTDLSNWQPEDFLQMAAICEAQQQYQCAADAYIQGAIGLGMGHPNLPADIHDRIWQTASRSRAVPEVFGHRYHQAWWNLQQTMRQAGSITAQITAWQNWQRRNPSHPASLQPPQVLTRLLSYEPPEIAILLPLSGSLAAAGQAARDGFIAAYLSESALDKPALRFYDSAAQDLGQVWETVLRDNNEVVVGPLLKENAERFAQLTAYATQPRLLLNYLNDTTRDRPRNPSRIDSPATNPLYQFGIAIEDEVSSLVNHVLDRGFEHVLVVHSQASWSRRALNRFRSTWPHELNQAGFADLKTLTESVGVAMQVADSEARKNELATILGTPLEFLPRARTDLQAVVALTSNLETRALVPALRFHFAEHLPVFATSQMARDGRLREMRGYYLTEMPMLNATGPEYSELQTAFSVTSSRFAELYALGYDAYRVATWLPVLTPDSQLTLPGASGQLNLIPGGRIERQLDLLRINQDTELEPAN